MKLITIVGLYILLFSLSACQNTKSGTSTSDSKQLNTEQVEGNWFVVSMDSGLEKYDFENYLDINLLKKKFNLNLKANTCGGKYSILNNQIKVERGIKCTEKCCDTPEGLLFSQVLVGTWDCKLDENWMIWTIEDKNKEIKFIRQTDKQLSVTEWEITRMVSKEKGEMEHLFEGEHYKILFSNQNSVRVQLKANHCVASFTQKGDKLSFFDYIGCSKACCDTKEANQLKDYFTNQTLKFNISGNQLTLSNENVELEFSRVLK
ncbi:MAG: META domain-containing protein [Aureispira sp.]|nr:META domain-containing protein [Aureispira sp.]